MRRVGRELLLKIEDIPVVCARNYRFETDRELIPLSAIQTGSVVNSKPGLISWAITSDTLITFGLDNYQRIFNYQQNGTTVAIVMADIDNVGHTYSGSGWIKSISLDTPYSEMAATNFVIIGTTPITVGVPAAIPDMIVENDFYVA